MKSNELVCRILDFLDRNINDDISIFNICQEFCYDKTYLMKKFKSEVGISIISYINRVRIYNSLEMLNSDESLLKIALSNGFNSLEYYSEYFSKIMGFSPSTMRRYFNDTLDKEELLIVREAINKMIEFRTFIYEYRFGPNTEQKLVFLQNKKYAA